MVPRQTLGSAILKTGLFVSHQRRHVSVCVDGKICHPETPEKKTTVKVHTTDRSPIYEYNSRVKTGRIRDDVHQREIVEILQNLHRELLTYHTPPIVHPKIENDHSTQISLFGGIFKGWSAKRKKKMPLGKIPDSVPRGLYLYGGVGSGKTMLMDLFYETLPASVASKTRIHFHNFMQDIHKRLHKLKMEHGSSIDGAPFIAADIAEQGNVLCFDEFQCTDVADAMILRRLLEALMSHGVVLVTTSNRHPDDLYLNGIQRESFVPCINLLKTQLNVINIDSPIDYRGISRPPSGVYHTPLDSFANLHAEKWFRFLGDPNQQTPHPETQRIWGREISVPKVSGRAAMFTFDQLIGRPLSAADYIELARSYDAFIVTDIPAMTYRERDLARRFITFTDAVYESKGKLVLTSEVPLTQLFIPNEVQQKSLLSDSPTKKLSSEGDELDDSMRNLMDDLGINMDTLKKSGMFSGDEEKFAFARALSRLSEMGSQEWVERGMESEDREKIKKQKKNRNK
ncbi:hypothetical protein K3495_g795 [Podosphaera aphanis]|nr:hypothetical protein K3495_g795 [Podosphaera aphanis]